MDIMSIGQVARQSGVSVEAIRFYEKKGLLDKPARTLSGYRQYPPGAVRRVRFIRHARDVGFTLSEIAELLDMRQKPGASCSDIKLKAIQKIESVDHKIQDLTRIREALAGMVMKCSGKGDLGDCPILEELEFQEHVAHAN